MSYRAGLRTSTTCEAVGSMGGGPEYVVPRKVGRLLGGENPRHWKRNTLIFLGIVFPSLSYVVFRTSADLEVRTAALCGLCFVRLTRCSLASAGRSCPPSLSPRSAGASIPPSMIPIIPRSSRSWRS